MSVAWLDINVKERFKVSCGWCLFMSMFRGRKRRVNRVSFISLLSVYLTQHWNKISKNIISTLEHIFWHCPLSKDFWVKLCNVLNNHNHIKEIRLWKEVVIFAISRTNSWQSFEHPFSYCKNFIYKYRFLKAMPTVGRFMPFLKPLYIV